MSAVVTLSALVLAIAWPPASSAPEPVAPPVRPVEPRDGAWLASHVTDVRDLPALFPPLDGGYPPSALLRPEYGAVPFVGRDLELAELYAWCTASDTGPRARLLCGAAGAGKTRLALVLARTAVDTDAWLVHSGDEAYTIELLAERARRPVLAILDDAEFRAPAGLADLTRREYAQPVRILLIAREAGPWWHRLRGVLGTADRPLTLDGNPLARPAGLHAPLQSLARAVGVDPSGVRTPRAEDFAHRTVHDSLAALLSAIVEEPLLDREIRHHGRFDATQVAQALALLTLFGSRAPVAGDLLEHLRRQYPSADPAERGCLVPGLLARRHVVETLDRDQDFAARYLRDVPERSARRTVASLSLAAERHDAAAAMLTTALRSSPAMMSRAASDVAPALVGPARAALGAAITAVGPVTRRARPRHARTGSR